LILNDAHCHFFSTKFFTALGKGLPGVDARAAADVAIAGLGWEAPGTPEQLADRWVRELDRHHVARAVLIASTPDDEESVGVACLGHPTRFVGLFMLDPTQPLADAVTVQAIDRHGLRGICLFPAMHRYPLSDERLRAVFEIAAARPGTAVFVHCGVLSVGVRKKLGLPSPFDIRFGNPLDLHALAVSFPSVPIIIPHFGAGLLREALMVADLSANVVLDTSSSNAWMRYEGPQLTLAAVFTRALNVLGAERLLFGTDSSFFPRGWVKDVFDRQVAALDEIGAGTNVKEKIFGGNFDRLFPVSPLPPNRS
jgi:predicted TIM-barrel fold metal-dependent hydrolase